MQSAALEADASSDGKLLRPALLFPPTTMDQVFGALAGDLSLTLEEIDTALEAEGARRARD